jgi:hypothetical protein
MGNWLVGQVTIFGFQAQDWMMIALAIIVVGIVSAWWSNR